MEKRDKEMPYEVIIQERNKVDLYGNVVYYIYWFDKYGTILQTNGNSGARVRKRNMIELIVI